MKRITILCISVLAITNLFAQSYNINLHPSVDVYHTLVRGITFNASVNVTNQSTSADINAFTMKWYLSSDSILSSNDLLVGTDDYDYDFFGPLEPGKKIFFGNGLTKVPSNYPTGCSFYVIMKVALDPSITETDYSDNTSFSKVCIRSKGVDLTVNSINFDKSAFFETIDNNEVEVTYTVKNQGENNYANPINISLFLADSSGTNLDTITQSIASLNSYETKTIIDTISLDNLPIGRYTVTAAIDADQLVSEYNESNNTKEKTVEIISEINDDNIWMKANGVDYISTCNSTVYDIGGPDGNYSGNGTSELYIYPSDSGKKIRITILEENYSYGNSMSLNLTDYIYFSTTAKGKEKELPAEFVSESSIGRVGIRQYLSSGYSYSGSKLVVTCASAKEYGFRHLSLNKEKYVVGLDTLNFSFEFLNRGFETINTDIYYAISTSDSLKDTIYTSPAVTSSSLAINTLKEFDYSLIIEELGIDKSGEYFLLVYSKLEDDSPSNNLISKQFNYVITETVIGQDVLFENGVTKYIKTCDATIYDDGGNGYYSNDFSGSIYLYPEDENHYIRVSGMVDVQTRYSGGVYKHIDKLNVYDINDEFITESESRYSFSTDFNHDAKTLLNGGLKLEFVSGELTNDKGLELNISCGRLDGPDLKNTSTYIWQNQVILGVDKVVTIDLSFVNNGVSNFTSGVQTQYFFSSSPAFTDTVFASSIYNNANKESWSRQDRVNLVDSIPGGTYYVFAVIDPNNLLSEVDKTNNVLMDSIEIISIENETRFTTASYDTVKTTMCSGNIYDYYGEGIQNKQFSSNSHIKISPETDKDTLEVTVTYMNETGVSSVIIFNNSTNEKIIDPAVDTFPYTFKSIGPNLPVYLRFNSGSNSSKIFDFEAYVSCNGIVLGNEKIQDKENFLISPNPATNVLYVNTKGEKHIYNSYGQLIISSSDHSIDISSLQKGLYYATTIINGTILSKSFIKE